MLVIAPLQRANHGDHFRAYRLSGGDMAALIDPFLGVDHLWMSAPTFPPHPHAGLSALSYLFLDSETGMDNRDSIGNHNLILPGGLHWTAAGRGIVHEEVPAQTGKTVHSLQIFVDLGREKRDMAPFALSLQPQDVPVVQSSGVKVRVPLGSYGGARSPLTPPTEVDMLDISLADGAELTIPIAEDHGAFVLPIFGTVAVGEQSFDPEGLKLPVYSAEATPQSITLRAPQGAARMTLFSGRPFR